MQAHSQTAKTARIRELNDAFRTTFSGGRVMLTVGVDSLPSDVKAKVLRSVASFSTFTADNDPRGEMTSATSKSAEKGSFGKSIITTARWSTGANTQAIRRRQPACSPSCSRKNTERSESVVSNRASGGARFFLLYRGGV